MKNILTIIILTGICTTLFSQIINVPADQPTIQAGINIALEGDTVLVAEGKYYENINFWGKAITVASNFILDSNETHIDSTIIDGSQFINPDSASVVTFCSGEDTTSIITGFTIQGGGGMVYTYWNYRSGGGISCWESGAKITHNKIINNEISDPSRNVGGAGIGSGLIDGDHWVIIENNVISNNSSFADAVSSFGGGVYILLNGTIKNNIIENNYCYNAGDKADGGGIEVDQVPESLIEVEIISNTIINNEIECELRTCGAGIVVLKASTTISNNIIQNNQNITSNISLGAGLFCDEINGEIAIQNNLFEDNIGPIDANAGPGGGICILEANDTKILVDRNMFINNIAKVGAGLYERNSFQVILTNNVFIDNTSKNGGGIGMFHPSTNPSEFRPIIANNTFYGNSASDKGGAVRFSGEINSPVIFNSLFWENESPLGQDINNGSDEEVAVFYSNLNTNYISGLWTGENNISENPLLLEDNYHLSECESSMINMGIDLFEFDEQWYFSPVRDIDDQPRPFETSMPDIGADETSCLVIIKIFYQEILSSTFLNSFPNPFKDQTTIEFSIDQTDFIRLSIIDYTGKEIQTLIAEQILTGTHQLEWNAEGLPSGIYFLRMETNGISETRKIVVLD